MREHTGPEHTVPKVTYLIPISHLSFYIGIWLQGIHFELENQHMCWYKHYYITNSQIRQPQRAYKHIASTRTEFCQSRIIKKTSWELINKSAANQHLQKNKRFQFSQGRRDFPRDVVIIQVQADEALKVTELDRDSSLDVVFVKFPTRNSNLIYV